ncbi:MAG: error-prone DNA polymerase [Sphingomonas sp.]|nr:error-prone DNA polymerase [Sphingomonas sp.]
MFAELVTATNYSFLRGASHPEEMVAEAIALGQSGIGIADRNTVAGVVRAHVAVREAIEKAPDIPFKLVVGARLVFADGTPDIVAYPATRHGWGRLCRLLTIGNRRAVKGGCLLGLSDLITHADDLLLIILPETSFVAEENVPVDALDPSLRRGSGGVDRLRWLLKAAPDRVWLAARMPYRGRDRRMLARRAALAVRLGVPLIATNDALYASPAARPLHDVLSCILAKTTIATAGKLLEANAERHLKSPDEMARLFRDYPAAIAESINLISQIHFSLDQLRYEYPHEPVPDGWTAQAWLQHIVLVAAQARYPGALPGKLCRLLYEEFDLIRERNYAYYFLTVYEMVKFARSVDPPILCQGRGSAANSVVCFLLGITSVDPMKYDLLFSRFVSSERDEPPDIDVDFEHERREEVMQHIYARYGRDHAGIAATVIHYRPRSAVREVGKVLGFTEDVTTRISSTVWGSYASAMEEKRFAETGFSLDDPAMQRLKTLVDQLLHFPRHLSQHVGGFVLTEGRLDELVPIHNAAMADRTFIEWDKDDIDALGLMKVDVLALGMLTCIQKSFEMLRAEGLADHQLDSIPADDPAVYDMLCKGDSIGVFQVESRAQINMLPRLKPRELYDLVIQVAIVRPGPIQGDMVHPYLRRRSGREKVEYPSPSPEHGPANELRDLLGKTFGVPLFQEQAMKLAIVAAKFTPDEANRLRKSMATFRHVGGMDYFEEKLVGGMVARGYEADFARRCFEQIKGFGSYGFPESHALAFARLVYVSSWIKCHHPAVFACALLNSQPMGFYAPAQIVRDAREHGVEVRGIDVAASGWDNGLELTYPPQQQPSPRTCSGAYASPRTSAREARWAPEQVRGDDKEASSVVKHPHAMRLGYRQITGFRAEWADAIVHARTAAPFTSIEDLARRAHLPQRALRLLADADAFRSIALDRREALWEVRRTPTGELPLFAAARARELGEEQDTALPIMSPAEHVVADYQMTRLSLKAHPMAFLREELRAEGILSCAETSAAKNDARVRTAGIVLVRQRPGNGNAIFITIEDETGVTNVVLWARQFEIFRRQVMASRLMLVEGQLQRSVEGVVHLMASRIIDRTTMLDTLSERGETPVERSRADEFDNPQHPRGKIPHNAQPRGSHPRNVRIIPKSRDFH